ncbi:hypothetical protein [Flammeovirga agarivorans]|uniref:Uncharacterized protein n=1 Tax=Flammeovirga agarivorans TaxID=2726742 RepID=A0A7X8SJN1_9BACT|nr:hypothetical protein [Flammeovirga agarivorans]NLR91485.1 hypothetical protein [Flammeovirga agarivorans]
MKSFFLNILLYVCVLFLLGGIGGQVSAELGAILLIIWGVGFPIFRFSKWRKNKPQREEKKLQNELSKQELKREKELDKVIRLTNNFTRMTVQLESVFDFKLHKQIELLSQNGYQMSGNIYQKPGLISKRLFCVSMIKVQS